MRYFGMENDGPITEPDGVQCQTLRYGRIEVSTCIRMQEPSSAVTLCVTLHNYIHTYVLHFVKHFSSPFCCLADPSLVPSSCSDP